MCELDDFGVTDVIQAADEVMRTFLHITENVQFPAHCVTAEPERWHE